MARGSFRVLTEVDSCLLPLGGSAYRGSDPVRPLCIGESACSPCFDPPCPVRPCAPSRWVLRPLGGCSPCFDPFPRLPCCPAALLPCCSVRVLTVLRSCVPCPLPFLCPCALCVPLCCPPCPVLPSVYPAPLLRPLSPLCCPLALCPLPSLTFPALCPHLCAHAHMPLPSLLSSESSAPKPAPQTSYCVANPLRKVECVCSDWPRGRRTPPIDLPRVRA